MVTAFFMNRALGMSRRRRGMKRRRMGRRLAAATVLILLTGIVTASAQDAAYGTSAAEIAERIAAAFPKVAGQVIGLEQERVLLDLGAKDQVIPGLELQVYREGQEFKHPYTGQVLGKLDRDVGRVRVLEVHPNFSAAEIIQQTEGTMVQQGDRVRVTSARVILALPNVDVSDVAGSNTRSVTRDLTNALVKSGRFEVMNDQRIRAALQEEKIPNPDQLADPKVLQALWKQLRVSAVLLSKLSLMEKAVNWDVQVISTVRGDSITLASSEVKGAAPRAASSASRGGGNFAGQEAPRIDQIALRSQELPFHAQAMAVGELTGDGTMKLAISDGQRVYIYDLTKTGIKEIWNYPGPGSDNVIAVDAADIKKSGVAQIYVTNYTQNGLRSYVLEYQNGKFVKILDELRMHFRVLEGPDGTPQLYGQEAGDDLTVANPFAGPVRRYTWQGNRLVGAEAVPLPKAFNMVFGFAVADLDKDGSSKVIILDRQDYLRVFDKAGSEIYRSSDHYGGSEIALEYYPEGSKNTAQNTGGSAITPKQIMLQGRMYFVDLMGDGKRQLVLTRNTPSTGYAFSTRMYDKGKILGVTWDGLGMQTVWETRELPGYIADFALVDPEGSGNRKLVLLVVQTNLMGMTKGRSSVVVLDIRPPG
jgi:hypothetical protein